MRDRLSALRTRLQEARARWVPGSLPGQPAPGFEGAPAGRVAAVVSRPAGPRAGGSAAEPAVGPFVPPGGPDADEVGALAEAAGALRIGEAGPWLAPLVTDPAPAIRAGALAGLALLGGEGVAERLAPALANPDRAVRTAAAHGLSRLGPRGVPALAAAAARSADDPEWLVALARALGGTAAPEAVPALTALLDGPAAAPAAAALGHLGAPAAPLVAALGRAGPGAQVEIIDALAQLGAAEAAAPLTDQLCADRPDVRAAAARALGKLRYEGASARLEALRSDYYGRVRRAAVEALSKLPTAGARGRGP
ncbi:MAG: HEAT repeat domain-containing protein [Anaeromyxobacter sp.]